MRVSRFLFIYVSDSAQDINVAGTAAGAGPIRYYKQGEKPKIPSKLRYQLIATLSATLAVMVVLLILYMRRSGRSPFIYRYSICVRRFCGRSVPPMVQRGTSKPTILRFTVRALHRKRAGGGATRAGLRRIP